MNSLEKGLKSLPKSSPEKIQRNSLEFFVNLRDKVVEEIGVKDYEKDSSMLGVYLYCLKNLATVDQVLLERKGSNKFLGKLNDFSLENLPEEKYPSSKNAVFIPFRLKNLQQIKTVDLLKLKSELEKYVDDRKNKFSSFNLEELPPEALEIVKKYNKTNVSELLLPGVDLSLEDISNLGIYIKDSFQYRNRKIKEFIAYRYALFAPVDSDLNEFINNAYAIIHDKSSSEKDFYRKHELKSSNMIVPVKKDMVSGMMGDLENKYKEILVSENKEGALKNALRFYIAFEIIHPFSDGNGRTGRVLFVNLQRRFMPDTKNSGIIHIPIARHESRSIYKQDDVEVNQPLTYLGSLSFEVDESLTNLLKKIKLDSFSSGSLTFKDIWDKLSSGDIDKDLDSMIELIKQQSSLDDLEGGDFNMIYESAVKNLK